MDIPNFYITSHTASWWFAFIMSSTSVIKESFLVAEGPSTSHYHLLSASASDKFVPLSSDHLSQSLVVVRVTCHSMAFCSHFTKFATQFCASYFVALRAPYHNATKITMCIIITPKHIIWPVWNELLCAGYSHSYQPFQAQTHAYGWWCSTWSFWESYE